jgi:hypothetical protein
MVFFLEEYERNAQQHIYASWQTILTKPAIKYPPFSIFLIVFFDYGQRFLLPDWHSSISDNIPYPRKSYSGSPVLAARSASSASICRS